MNISEEFLNHWSWQAKPFAKGQALIDIFLQAAQNTTYFRGNLYPLNERQFITSETVLCERWGWSRTKVRSFLSTLCKDSLIEINRTMNKTTITILQNPFIHVFSQESTQEKTQDSIQPKEQDEKQSEHQQIEGKSGPLRQEKEQDEKPKKDKKLDNENTEIKPILRQKTIFDDLEEKKNES